MKLIFVRHGIAEDKEAFAETGEPDALRPLTGKGKSKMIKAARGLKKIAPSITILVSSPYTRAVETARIIGKVYGNPEIHELEDLVPGGDSGGLFKFFEQQDGDSTVVMTGHEPFLGNLVSACLSVNSGAFVVFKKGGAGMVEFPGKPGRGKGTLVWLLEPGHLQAIGEE